MIEGNLMSKTETKVKYVCRHCKVEVNSSHDKRPVLGKEHKKSCPRHRILG